MNPPPSPLLHSQKAGVCLVELNYKSRPSGWLPSSPVWVSHLTNGAYCGNGFPHLLPNASLETSHRIGKVNSFLPFDTWYAEESGQISWDLRLNTLFGTCVFLASLYLSPASLKWHQNTYSGLTMGCSPPPELCFLCLVPYDIVILIVENLGGGSQLEEVGHWVGLALRAY